MRSKSSWRLADRSCFESCSASVRARRSSSNWSLTGRVTASRRRRSRMESRLDRTCVPRTTSSSVESIVIAGASSSRISSTTAAASRRPCVEMASEMRAPWLRSISSVSSRSTHFGLPARRRSSSCASQSLRISACASSKASSSVCSGTSFAPASTIVRPSLVPTTMRSSSEPSSISGSVGLTTSSPSTIPTRTPPTGPRKGSGEIWSAAEAPLMARMSCGVTRSAESVVQMTCTSFLKPWGQSGRIGRSIMRAVRIARSVGRPSRLKNPPGILPAAYIRSSTSTVSGKKSAPSRASRRPCAVARIMVSPLVTTTAPSACLARWPVSKTISSRPTVTATEAFDGAMVLMCLLLLVGDGGGGLRQARRGRPSPSLPQTSTRVSRTVVVARGGGRSLGSAPTS